MNRSFWSRLSTSVAILAGLAGAGPQVEKQSVGGHGSAEQLPVGRSISTSRPAISPTGRPRATPSRVSRSRATRSAGVAAT